MAENTTVEHTSIADVLELARRDIARTQTDFLGRMNACLMDYEAICDDYPEGDFGEDKDEADEAISGLAGLALAQVMMLRGEEMPSNNLIAAAPELYEALAKLLDHYTRLVNCGDCGSWNPEVEPEILAARAALLKASPRVGGEG